MRSEYITHMPSCVSRVLSSMSAFNGARVLLTLTKRQPKSRDRLHFYFLFFPSKRTKNTESNFVLSLCISVSRGCPLSFCNGRVEPTSNNFFLSSTTWPHQIFDLSLQMVVLLLTKLVFSYFKIKKNILKENPKHVDRYTDRKSVV